MERSHRGQAASHAILVGLPGVGKSSVGALLADRLGRTFMDLDREIERRAGMPITRIFSEHGEETFREMERDLTMELRVAEPMVLAPGGGWITRSETVALLRPPGCIIYMRAAPETAFRRMGAEWALRPLLAAGGNGLERLTELYRARRATYEGADVAVDTELLSPQQVAEKIAAIVVSLERAG